jgi:hypothetical protein
MALAYPNANTWEKFFLKNVEAEASNKLIIAIREKILDTTTYVEKHDIFSKSPGIMYMTYDVTLDEIHVHHSPQVVGGSLQNPVQTLAALDGFGCEAIPIIFAIPSLKDVSYTCPDWTAFQTVEGNAATFRALPATTGANYIR